MTIVSTMTIVSHRSVPLGEKPTYTVGGICNPDIFDSLSAARLYTLREARKLKGGHFPPFAPTHVIVHPRRRIDVRMIENALFIEDEWEQCSQAEWLYNPKTDRLYFQGLLMTTRWSLKPFILFKTAFEQDFIGIQSGWAAQTLILRIEPAGLLASGSNIRLTLHASTMGSSHVDRIYVSQPDPTPGANPYDAAADLTKIWDDPLPNELIVSAGAELIVPEMPYDFDRRRPLLIALEFSIASASGISYARPVSPSRASAYWFSGQEAAIRKRSPGYSNGIAEERFHFVGLVETGDVVRVR